MSYCWKQSIKFTPSSKHNKNKNKQKTTTKDKKTVIKEDPASCRFIGITSNSAQVQAFSTTTSLNIHKQKLVDDITLPWFILSAPSLIDRFPATCRKNLNNDLHQKQISLIEIIYTASTVSGLWALLKLLRLLDKQKQEQL